MFFYVFLVKIYTNHIKFHFHILIVICEFCYILQKMLCQREWCMGVEDVLPGWKFCVRTLKSKKPKQPFKNP